MEYVGPPSQPGLSPKPRASQHALLLLLAQEIPRPFLRSEEQVQLLMHQILIIACSDQDEYMVLIARDQTRLRRSSLVVLERVVVPLVWMMANASLYLLLPRIACACASVCACASG